MNDFTRGVKKKLRSRSAIYAALFLLLMILQQIWEARGAQVTGEARHEPADEIRRSDIVKDFAHSD